MSGPTVLDPLLAEGQTPPPARSRRTGAPASEMDPPPSPYDGAAESLDYETPITATSLRKAERERYLNLERRHLWGCAAAAAAAPPPRRPPAASHNRSAGPSLGACSYSGSTLTKMVATLGSGIAIGLTAAVLQLAVDYSIRRRNRLLGTLLLQGLPPGFAAMLGISLAAVLLATLAVHYCAPKAGGGGVALVSRSTNSAWYCPCGARPINPCLPHMPALCLIRQARVPLPTAAGDGVSEWHCHTRPADQESVCREAAGDCCLAAGGPGAGSGGSHDPSGRCDGVDCVPRRAW